MVSQVNNMKFYYKNKEALVRFVSAQLQILRNGSQLTMTIERTPYADFYATFATENLSDITAIRIGLNARQPTSEGPPHYMHPPSVSGESDN